MKTRLFIERKNNFDIEKKELQKDLLTNFGLNLSTLRYFITYDVFNIDKAILGQIINEVFIEINKDNYFFELPNTRNIIAYESLPGQFDQRSDSAMQCIRLLSPNSNPIVNSGVAILFDEVLNEKELYTIKNFLINKVE